MLCIIQTQVSGFKDYTASPPLEPIVLGGNNAIMANAEERPASLPSNSQDLMWPQAIARVAATRSSCASSHFSCRVAKHQECVHENVSNIINILMPPSLMWASFISPNHSQIKSLPCTLFHGMPLCLLLKKQTLCPQVAE